MKILLIYPPVTREEVPLPHGIAYVAAVLLRAGHDVEIWEIQIKGWSQEQVVERLKSTDYDLVGISGIVTQYGYVKWLAQVIKEINNGKKIIAGGSVSSSIPRLLLEKTAVDIAVIGEGEETAVELLDRIKEDKDLKGLRGIWYKQNGKVIENPLRPRMDNLDAIPYPAYQLLDMQAHFNLASNKLLSKFSSCGNFMGMITSRGCPYHCTYCYRNFGRKVRYRSIENVINEIKLYKKEYNVRRILFQDEIFTVNQERIRQLCLRLKSEKINLRWGCVTRVDHLDRDLISLMNDAGCRWLSFGLESGSQKMLDEMKKNATVEQAKEALGLARRFGIQIEPSMMLGMPGENEQTVEETIKFCRDTKTFIRKFFFVTPYPGTELYEYAKVNNLIKDEEKFIESLRNAYDFAINLTKLPDERLKALKRKAEVELLNQHKLRVVFRLLMINIDLILKGKAFNLAELKRKWRTFKRIIMENIIH